MKVNPTPIFIFSLPRSGSTLLQRTLAIHNQISTVSEPWILLPFFYTMKKRGIYSEYGQATLAEALEDLCSELPNGKQDYFEEVKNLVLNIYSKLSRENTKYFLDKTPRYHLIIEEIIQLFPQAKFIFLWRNPLAVAASMIQTHSDGNWSLYNYKIDLYQGLESMVNNYKKYHDNVYSLKYESFINEPENELKKILNYLDIDWNSNLLTSLDTVELKGRKGDKTGYSEYTNITNKSYEKWKNTMKNPIRKSWCKNYLQWIGEERLNLMGYSIEQLNKDLDNIPFTLDMIPLDLLRISFGAAWSIFEFRIWKHKIDKLPDWRKVYIYGGKI